MANDRATVLLIEKDCELRELIARILNTAHYQIEQLPENADPVDFATQIRPQVIVTRVRPLEPQDQEVVAYLLLSPRTRDIPVVVIHTLEHEGRAVAALPNVGETLGVPFSLASLRAAVARALEGSQRKAAPSYISLA